MFRQGCFFIILFAFSCSSPKTAPTVGAAAKDKNVPVDLPDEPAPPLKPAAPGFIRFDQQEEAMVNAVNALPQTERLKARMIICTDQYNVDGAQSVKECKDGVTKALNSISSEVQLAEPTAIGPAGSILMINLDDFGLTPSKWKLIENADPFKFTSETVRGRTLQFLTQSIRPFINGHNFTETALTTAYYGLTEIPNTFDVFRQSIGVNAQKQFDERDPDLLLMGMNESLIASNRQFRQIIRLSGTFGPLWCTGDTNDVNIAPVNIDGVLVNQKNLPEAPFPLEARSNKIYVDNAGECMFIKPNGMIGYALFEAGNNGLRQNVAPTNIVQDTASAGRGLSGTIENARACFRCHASGFIPIKDTVGSQIAASPNFNAKDKSLARLFFKTPAAGAEFFREDNEAYARTLERLNVDNITEDAVNNLTDKLRLEQDAKQVSALLGITEEELKTGLRSSLGASAIIGNLLQPGGKVNLQALIDGLPILIQDMNLFQDDN